MRELVTWLFHPTVVDDDLADATDWFQRACGRRGIRWEEEWDLDKLKPGYPVNYSIFVIMGDVVIDALAPSLITLPSGKDPGYPKGNGLVDLAWYVDDIQMVADEVREGGIELYDQDGSAVVGRVPEANNAPDCYILWTRPKNTGLPHELYELGAQYKEKYANGDPRLDLIGPCRHRVSKILSASSVASTTPSSRATPTAQSTFSPTFWVVRGASPTTLLHRRVEVGYRRVGNSIMTLQSGSLGVEWTFTEENNHG